MDIQPENSKTTMVKSATKARSSDDVSQISIQEFLNFLKTAYQIQDSVEGILMSGGMSEAVKWLKRKENQLSLKSICCQTSDTIINANKGSGDDKKVLVIDVNKKRSVPNISTADPLKGKLNEVLSEGLLDSVLPYLVQNASSLKKSSLIKLHDKPSINNPSANSSNDKVAVRRSNDSSVKSTVIKPDVEAKIHVIDEVRNMKKTFFCNPKIILENMGYFTDISGGQRLEEMDISVHCDVTIFEWLMGWVKRDTLLEADRPELDPHCVVPIIVSASFLQMEPLLHTGLLYCHQHMNEILRANISWSCVNDSVLTKLAAMYTNVEVESIKDRKDRIQSRLFIKLIQSLAEPEPESMRGHWCSLARVFKCEKCEQLITPSIAVKIPCVPFCMRLQPDGSVISLHVKDPTWNINDYITKLHKILRTWRKVYWRLWGDAHFLFCSICKRYFPCNQVGWCRYHPDAPQFFTLDAQKAPLPIGRYPCCGERAYRFQLLENFSGCQFRQHMVCTQDVRDSQIFTMLESYRHIIEEEPPQLLFPERLTRLVARDINNDKKFICKETFWWEGFEIIPPRPRMGLLSIFANRRDESSTSEESSEEDEEEDSTSSTSSESDEGSVECNPLPKKVMARKRSKKKRESQLWQHNLSARSNQDIQRAYEEFAVKEMTAILNRSTLNDNIRNYKNPPRNVTPLGGVWVRLEAEWKESYNQMSSQQKPKNIFTNGKIQRPRGK